MAHCSAVSRRATIRHVRSEANICRLGHGLKDVSSMDRENLQGFQKPFDISLHFFMPIKHCQQTTPITGGFTFITHPKAEQRRQTRSKRGESFGAKIIAIISQSVMQINLA